MSSSDINKCWFYTETWCCVCKRSAFGLYTSEEAKVGCLCSDSCQDMYDLNPLAYGEFQILLRSDLYSQRRKVNPIRLNPTIILR